MTPDEMYALGMRYLTGDGVPRDNQAAKTWLVQSADAGSELAKAMRFRSASERKTLEASARYKKQLAVAEAGHPVSALQHGIRLWEFGDFDDAIAWLGKAARKGESDALNRLSEIFRKGLGVEKNEKIADELLDIALDAENFEF